MITMKDIFDKCNLGNLELQNRIVRSGLWESQADPQGRLTSAIYDRYEQLSSSKIGLIITELIYLYPKNNFSNYAHKIYNPYFVSDFRKLTDMVHRDNTPILAQLVFDKFHRGIDKNIQVNDLTMDDIRRIQTDIILNAKKIAFAGFDGIQLSIGNNFYLSKFIDPYFNQRDDDYGASTFNRLKIILETVKVLKDNYNLHINCKINAYDGRKGGITPDESIKMCKLLEEYGVDSLQITKPLSPVYFTKDEVNNELVEYTTRLNEEVSIPVILGGGLSDKERMNDILNTSNIEYMSMLRPFIAQPSILNEWRDGINNTSRCLMCNNCYRTKTSSCYHF